MDSAYLEYIRTEIIHLKKYGAKKSSYQYLITFTVDTKKSIDYKRIEEYILNLKPFQKDNENTIRCHYVKEIGKGGNHHWHFAIESKKYIIGKTFQYYKNIYGFVQVNKSVTKTYNDCLTYLEKVNKAIQLRGVNNNT